MITSPSNVFDSPSAVNGEGLKSHMSHPITTGTSVLGVKFDGGVAIAADTLVSYGSLAKFRNIHRIIKVNERTVIAASGEIADFHFLNRHIQKMINDDYCENDGVKLSPKAVYSWLTRVMYNARSKFSPFWNRLVVAGMEGGTTPFLGYVDLLGIAYEAPSIATGLGAYMAQPIMRDALEKPGKLNAKSAADLLDECQRVLFYRDARSYDKYDLAIITSAGVEIKKSVPLKTDWTVAEHIGKGEVVY